MRTIAAAIALRAPDVYIAQKLHLDLFKSSAAAPFALTLRRIEAERTGAEPPLAGQIRFGEQLADIVKRPYINHRIRAWCATQSRLIDHHDATQILPTFKAPGYVARLRRGRFTLLSLTLSCLNRRERTNFIGARSSFQMRFEPGLQNVANEGRFARAAHAGQTNEAAQWNFYGDILYVVAIGAFNPQTRCLRIDRPASRSTDLFSSAQILARERMRRAQDFAISSLKNDVASCFAVTGAQINNLLSGAHHARLMLHDHDRVSQVAQLLHDLHQPARVACVQSHARFIQDVECVDQASAQTGRKIHPFGFPAGERSRRPIERQIIQADIHQILQPRSDFVQDETHRV